MTKRFWIYSSHVLGIPNCSLWKMIVVPETNINAPNTQVPCVNSCCAHRFGEPALRPDAAASPGWERRAERSFPPSWSRRPHRRCHSRRRPPLWTRWSTWRAMTARSPSFIPRQIRPPRFSAAEDKSDEQESHKQNFSAQNHVRFMPYL